MEIKGILFDKDGTLIDFYDVWGTSAGPVMDRILKAYGLASKKGVKDKLLESIGVHGTVIDSEGALAWKPYAGIAYDLKQVLAQENVNVSCESLTEQLRTGFYEEISIKRQTYPVFTDMKKLMETLNQMGIKTGVATTDEYESTRICMEKIGISKWISFYGTSGINGPEKPDGELILLAANEWNLKPEEIAVVGDTPNDMRFAHNGKAMGIGVLSGTGKKEELELLADEIMDSVDDLLNLVKRRNGIGNKEN